MTGQKQQRVNRLRTRKEKRDKRHMTGVDGISLRSERDKRGCLIYSYQIRNPATGGVKRLYIGTENTFETNRERVFKRACALREEYLKAHEKKLNAGVTTRYGFVCTSEGLVIPGYGIVAQLPKGIHRRGEVWVIQANLYPHVHTLTFRDDMYGSPGAALKAAIQETQK